MKILSTIYASEKLAKACRTALHYTISQVPASAGPAPGSGYSRRSAADRRWVWTDRPLHLPLPPASPCGRSRHQARYTRLSTI